MIIIKNCTFKGCALEDEAIPNGQVEWFCSCGHMSEEEHKVSLN